ncbi:MAG: hypothetical protein ACYTF3_11440 [Planctomycetota bacterium]|jgi:hypothetical protein
MHATSPRRGLAHPALLLVGLTAAGAFLLGQRSAVAQDPGRRTRRCSGWR